MTMNHYVKDRDFLGQGLAFPLQQTPTRRLKLVSGETDIQQAIRIILGTMPGERLLRPEFGCRIYELVFAPNDAATEGLIVYYVREALARWEPRIEVQDVTVQEDDAGGCLQVQIHYRIKATHDERSIVYPFYLLGET